MEMNDIRKDIYHSLLICKSHLPPYTAACFSAVLCCSSHPIASSYSGSTAGHIRGNASEKRPVSVLSRYP